MLSFVPTRLLPTSVVKILLIATATALRATATSLDQQYDYVIVGGGPAGFVLAEQLSANPNVSVILLEAGLDASDNVNVTIPGFATLNEFSDLVWDYYVTPQRALDGATPRLAQGKLFGGGTGVNYMGYNRCSKTVFDDWAKLSGNDALAWNSLLEDFKATVSYQNNSVELDYQQPVDYAVYGDGPVNVTRALSLDGFAPSWTKALVSTLGLPEVDFNAGAGVGVSYGFSTINPSNRTRAYALPAWGYQMAQRTNAHLLHGAYVTKINFSGTHAESVTYTDTNNGNTTHVIHGKEIIVSAGAIGSPRLLMLSGVGPASHLKDVGVPVILDSPAVGSNLRDHNYAILEIQVPNNVYDLSRWTNASYLQDIVAQWTEDNDGPLANTPASTFALFRVPDSALPAGPAGDFQRAIPHNRGQLQMQYVNGGILPNISSPTTPVLSIFIALTQPEASGQVRLNSSDPFEFPLINTAYFGTEGDRAAILWGYKKVREVLASPHLRDLVIEELYPGPQAQTDAELWQAIRGSAQSYHHPQGTVSLGTVLDANFRVKGVKGLRVVDISTFPTPPNCFPQADVYALAHVAARQIREVDDL